LWLVQNGLVNHDTKPDNILVVEEQAGRRFVRVDLGSMMSLETARTVRHASGTKQFCAPERLQQGYDLLLAKMDAWSLARTMLDFVPSGSGAFEREAANSRYREDCIL
jgi:serine/threonine protein kinase